MRIERLAMFRGFIVTANRDGTIPLNTRVLAMVDLAPETGEATARELIAAYNKLAFIVEERDEDY